MNTTAANITKAKVGIAIIAVALVGWFTFVLGAWNHNLFLTIIPFLLTVVLRSLKGKALINIKDDLEMVVFGILLWNHWVAVIVILFILKVFISKLRK